MNKEEKDIEYTRKKIREGLNVPEDADTDYKGASTALEMVTESAKKEFEYYIEKISKKLEGLELTDEQKKIGITIEIVRLLKEMKEKEKSRKKAWSLLRNMGILLNKPKDEYSSSIRYMGKMKVHKRLPIIGLAFKVLWKAICGYWQISIIDIDKAPPAGDD